MKMTRKEAAHVLECGAWWDHLPDDMSDADMNPLQDALDVALAALRCDWVDAEKHWHCKPGSLASDYVPKPEPKFDGVEYRRHTCPHCQHEWLEDRDASDYPNYCPACGEPLGKED